MSRQRWVVSLFVIGHLSAIAVAAIPQPGKLPKANEVRYPAADRLAAVVTPVLDTVALSLADAPSKLWTATASPRSLATTYLHMLGYDEQWMMFSNPPPDDEYVRMRYFVTNGSTKAPGLDISRTVTELVFPAHREDAIRGLQSFRDSYRDKVFNNALDQFHRRLRDPEFVTHAAEESHQIFVPVARYFSRRFVREHLAPGERLARAEMWHGTAENPPPGLRSDTRDDRWRMLQPLYRGHVEEHGDAVRYGRLFSSEPQGDIIWTLEYTENR